jgi:aerobic carbon-monoxide dehydrogenase small subunit
MTHHVSVSINGAQTEGDIDSRLSLGDFLRDACSLTGTHLGCEHGVCGACTVLVDDEPVRSCIFYAVQADGLKVRTIEGFEDDDVMRRLRLAFSVHHALQCGFCTAGMLITGRDIIRRLGSVDEDRIREELAGNLCRCTGYVGIVKAIQDVAEQVGHSIQPEPALATTAVILPNVVADPPAKMKSTKNPAVSSGATPGAETPAVGARSAPGGFSVKRIIAITYPIELVWQEFSDPFAIAACLPGAELTERDGDRLLGRVQIKMGPIKAQFHGEAIYALEDRTKSGSMVGGGRDSLSNSRASGELQFRMSSAQQNSTALEINLTFSLQGMLAQFSRPAIVNDFTSFIIEQFLENLSHRLQDPSNIAKVPVVALSFSSLVRWRAAKFWKRLTRKSSR